MLHLYLVTMTTPNKIQVFDSNASGDKSFKFKIGKGKVIKARCYIYLFLHFINAYILNFRVGRKE